MKQENFPIVKSPFKTSKYEEILLTILRDVNTDMQEFKDAAEKLAESLIVKIIEILPVKTVRIKTPLTPCEGKILSKNIHLVSIMRSGDTLLHPFMRHFPNASVSKILIQRDEKTALPFFKYLKISPDIQKDDAIIILEPMIATGGTLEMAIKLLKERQFLEENIFIASICSAPTGLSYLNDKFPKINVVLTVLDDCLNEQKYIVPGLGDFGDRYYGTLNS